MTPSWSKNGLLSAASFVFRNHRAEFATLYLLLCGSLFYNSKKIGVHLSPRLPQFRRPYLLNVCLLGTPAELTHVVTGGGTDRIVFPFFSIHKTQLA